MVLLYDGRSDENPIIVLASTSHWHIARTPVVLRADDPDNKHTILDAALASTATPVYFPPAELSTGEYVSSSAGDDSPTLILIEKAKYGGIQLAIELRDSAKQMTRLSRSFWPPRLNHAESTFWA